MFLHGFQQGTLHLCRRTVDFVGKYEVGEHRAFLHVEGLVLLRIDLCADYVCRQQVGGKLDAAVFRVDQLRERLDGKGLCQSRYTLEQDVPVAEQ